jgi:hypothetical protein
VPKIKKDEYYVLQPQRAPDTVRMTKFVNDEPKEDSSYVVTRSSCQCFQSGRGQCRHMIMHQTWRAAGHGRMKVRFYPPDEVTWEPLAEEGLFDDSIPL